MNELSTIDMTIWMLANLNRGELNGRRILRAPSDDLLWAPTVKATGPAYVGLSWFIRDYSGHRTVYHAGGDTGFRAYVLLAPDDGIGIALASNWEEMPRETLVEKTLDMLLASDGRRPRLEAASTTQRQLQSRSSRVRRGAARLRMRHSDDSGTSL